MSTCGGSQKLPPFFCEDSALFCFIFNTRNLKDGNAFTRSDRPTDRRVNQGQVKDRETDLKISQFKTLQQLAILLDFNLWRG